MRGQSFPVPDSGHYKPIRMLGKNVEKTFLSRTEAVLLRSRVIILKAVSPCNGRKDRAQGKRGETGKAGLRAGT